MFCWLLLFCFYQKRRLDICVLAANPEFCLAPQLCVLFSVWFWLWQISSPGTNQIMVLRPKIRFGIILVRRDTENLLIRIQSLQQFLPCLTSCLATLPFLPVWDETPWGNLVFSHIYTTPLLCLNDQHTLINKTPAPSLFHPALLMIW